MSGHLSVLERREEARRRGRRDLTLGAVLLVVPVVVLVVLVVFAPAETSNDLPTRGGLSTPSTTAFDASPPRVLP